MTLLTEPTRSKAARRPKSPSSVPALQNGDSLDGDEFMRRYEAMPDVKKAELIGGIVYMASPVRHDQHAQPHVLLTTWLGLYMSHHPGCEAGNNGTVRLAKRNVPQPDLYLLRPEGRRKARIEDGYLHGAPDLVCEISASTASLDAHKKLRIYQRYGVGEYLIWRTEQEMVDWLVLGDDGKYGHLPETGGVIESRAFPGLKLDRAALLRGDLAAVLAAL